MSGKGQRFGILAFIVLLMVPDRNWVGLLQQEC